MSIGIRAREGAGGPRYAGGMPSLYAAGPPCMLASKQDRAAARAAGRGEAELGAAGAQGHRQAFRRHRGAEGRRPRRSSPARSSASWATTAPASRRWSRSSPATSRRPRARSASTARSKHFHKPVDARAEGIEVVYQDLALCDNLTAAENVFLGRELKRSVGPFRFLDYGGHVRPRRRAVRRAQVRDPAARPRQADVGRPAPGGRDRPHPALRRRSSC